MVHIGANTAVFDTFAQVLKNKSEKFGFWLAICFNML